MKPAHKTFIIEMIKYGDKTSAYRKAYPNCTDNESARKSAERLLRHHPDISAEIEEATAYIQQRSYAEAYRLHTEQHKTKLLSMMDRREILARIAKCEIKVCRYIKDGDRYRMLFEDPHPREIIRAVEVDTRMEDICNRARNLADPKLSQFNIYIDGRPCDDPTAPVNDMLPPGIVMLPRRTKKLMEEHGNKMEHFFPEDTHHTSPLQGDLRGKLAPETLDEEQENILEQNNIHHTSPPPGDLGVHLPPEKSPDEEQGNKKEQNNETDSFPVIREGGTNEVSDGRVDSRRTLAPEKSPIEEQGINPEQNITLSPLGGGGEVRAGGGTLAQEKKPSPLRLSDSAVQHSNTEHPSPPRGEGQGVRSLPPENSPLYPQYLALYQKRMLQAEDLLAASFYEQEKKAIASAPPPHILTPEEVQQLCKEADEKQ